MRSWLRFLLVAVVAVLAQATVMRAFSVGGVRPDLLVAVLVTYSLGARRADGFVVGCVLGLARDVFSLEPLGLSTGVFALLGYALSGLRLGAFAEHVLPHVFFGFVCSAASSGASLLALAGRERVASVSAAVRFALAAAVATAILSGLVGALLRIRPRWFGLRRRTGFEEA